ncbi:MAG: hypothetical protein KAV00_02830 [Phycisphaerae bacterium]|nr:hypothetical protein [Phycisphaerae bacterium]
MRFVKATKSIVRIAPVGLVILVMAGALDAAPPVISNFSSEGGSPANKDNARDTMYLLKPGDKVAFKVNAEGAAGYEWQVNKAVQKAKGDTFIWAVPKEKGIWEIHLKVTNKDGQAHHEWVISTLGKDEAPDFFEYFTDRKYRRRTDTDPWGRALPTWYVDKNITLPEGVDVADCMLLGPSRGPVDGHDAMTANIFAPSDTVYGTWRIRYIYPQDPTEGSTCFRYYLLHRTGCGLNPFFYCHTRNGHNYFRTPGYIDHDSGFNPTSQYWYELVIIRTPDNYVHGFIDGVLEYKRMVSTLDNATAISLRMNRQARKGFAAKGIPFTFTDGWTSRRIGNAAVDTIEIYKDKFLFPKKSAKYAWFFDKWIYSRKPEGVEKWWRKTEDGKVFFKYPDGREMKVGRVGPIPVARKGVVVEGRGMTLAEIARMVNDPKLFTYDAGTKTAVCRTNLVVDGAAELIIKDETLKFQGRKDGNLVFAVMYGADLKIINSKLTSEGEHFWCWRMASVTHLGNPIGRISSPQNAGLCFQSLVRMTIRNSHIDNCAYFFISTPNEFYLTNTRFTNLHEVDTGEYSGHRKKKFARGKKGFWLLFNQLGYHGFSIENVSLEGKKSPLNPTFILNDNLGKLNILNVDMAKETVVVRKSLRMESDWNDRGTNYNATLGLVNCRFADIQIPTDRAWAVPKYYLDVKVVDAGGKPVPNAKVTITNEIDDKNHPAENLLVDKRWIKHYCLNFGYGHLPPKTWPDVNIIKTTNTGPDGHIPLPSDKANTVVLSDYITMKKGEKRADRLGITWRDYLSARGRGVRLSASVFDDEMSTVFSGNLIYPAAMWKQGDTHHTVLSYDKKKNEMSLKITNKRNGKTVWEKTDKLQDGRGRGIWPRLDFDKVVFATGSHRRMKEKKIFWDRKGFITVFNTIGESKIKSNIDNLVLTVEGKGVVEKNDFSTAPALISTEPGREKAYLLKAGTGGASFSMSFDHTLEEFASGSAPMVYVGLAGKHTSRTRIDYTYRITVEKDGLKKVITGVNPGPHWYRSDPGKPTYTITAVLHGS